MAQDELPSPGFLLHDVARLMRRNFTRRSGSVGLTLAQCRALMHLSRNEGVRQVDLAETLECQPITLARLLDQLAEAGYVERRPDPDDRRAFRLALTPAAKPALARIRALANQTWNDAVGELGDARLAQFAKTLADLKQNLMDAEAAAGAAEKERHVA
jgi:MarR family transcriptional regulator, transcriptional regulator for hemolysin